MTDLEMATFRLRRDAVSWRREGDGMLLYDLERDIVYNGNFTALWVIELCDGRHTVGEIAGHFATRYEIPHPQALADVVRIIRQMIEWHLIERAT